MWYAMAYTQIAMVGVGYVLVYVCMCWVCCAVLCCVVLYVCWYVWGSGCVQEAMCVDTAHLCKALMVQGIAKNWFRDPCTPNAELRQQCNTQGNEVTTTGKY